jgi:plastocyanin
MRSLWPVGLVMLVVVAACGSDEGRDGALVVDDPTAVEFDYEYVIPLGTGAKFDAGEVVEILPGEMTVRVGEVMRIINLDNRQHLIGPFFVGAGETLTQRFASAGEYTGICTVHPSGEFVLTVEE